MRKLLTFLLRWVCVATLLGCCTTGCDDSDAHDVQPIPEAIQRIMTKPRYAEAAWGLRVVDMDSGDVIYDLKPDVLFETGSVRKLFSIAVTLNALGADYRFITPVYRQGAVDSSGVLHGNLIIVASGDLTLGGRQAPGGTIEITNFDHNEANSLGNAILTTGDPFAGLNALAQQVAAAGITRVEGDVIIDDRLFEPFLFRGEFLVKPIYINDDLIDVSITPTTAGALARVDWRPQSAAFTVRSEVVTVAAGEPSTMQLQIAPDNPHVGLVTGQIPENFLPPLTNQLPLVQTFRIQDPSAYARTAFIEALARVGVPVTAAAVGPNPTAQLPPATAYPPETKVTAFVSPPYAEYAKYILKVSYNLGADTSLMLFGVTRGVRTLNEALAAERQTLQEAFALNGAEFHFIDGSGGPGSFASTPVTIKLLKAMSAQDTFRPYLQALPILGVDGSLATVEVESPARGSVFAKTGTTIIPNASASALSFTAQSYAGYITAHSGKRLLYALYVNNAGLVREIADVLEVFNDQGRISTIIWQDN